MSFSPESPFAPVNVSSRAAIFLEDQREKILKVWTEGLRQNLRVNLKRELDDPSLLDHLPRLFDDLTALLLGEAAVAEQISRDAETHGQNRWRQEYTLPEVLKELGIVSRLLLEHGMDAFADANPEISREELRPTRETILVFFEDAACGSVRQYVFEQQEQASTFRDELHREERSQAAAVQSHHDRLADIFQRSPSFLAILRGPEHVFQLANNEYARVTGFRDLVGKSVRQALPEAVGQGFVTRLDRVYATGESYVGNNTRVMLQSGPGGQLQEHFLDFVYLPTRDEQGRIDGIVVHGVDWTERKRAQQEVGELSEQRRLALDSADMGSWHFDLVNAQVYWDDQFKRIFGVTEGELSYERILARLHPDDREEVSAAIDAASRPDDPVPYAIEHRILQPDGSWRWVQAHGKTHFEGEGSARRAVSLVGTVRDVTESKTAQETLRKNEEKYRALFNSMDQAYAVIEMIWDEAGQPHDYRFLEVNPAMERHTGWQDAAGRTARELIRGLEDHWPQTYGQVARTGKPLRFVQGAEGMGRVFDVNAFRVGTPEQPLVAILFQDVTAQHRAKATLAQLAEQRRLALDSAGLGWWHFDPVARTVEWDERAQSLYGQTTRHLPYEDCVALIHPDDRRQRSDALQAAMNPDDPQPYLAEYRVIRPDGTVRWLQIKGQASFAGEGAERHAVGLDGTVADVTDAREIADVLRESEARFRQLADSMPQIVWTARPDGVLDYVNRRWYEFIQKTEEEWDVADWVARVHPDDLPGTAVIWQASVDSGNPYGAEFRLERADGEYRWFLVRALPVHDAEGKINRWYGTCTDVQDQRALIEQNANLLESERAARTESERTSHMKDEFLATLSHELRTPLNAILGWSQVLRDDPANSEDMTAGLATIERNARAQTQIIEDLLDMSRIISGKVRLDVQKVDLAVVVAAAVETVRPAATAKGIRLQPVLDPLCSPINGDPNRLQQVFWNLLSNAIKFTPKGGKVQVVLARVNSHLEVCVIDSGEGIAPEFLPYVFDRFRQQDASTTRRHGGLGLGLAIVKQLAELHGGGVQVESAGAGQGTTFRVTLPLVALRTDADDAQAERRHPRGGDESVPIPAELLRLDGVRVIVVDDEADSRGLVKRLLEDRGVAVRAAGSVAEAAALFQAEPPDVLVSDIGMPGEDGYGLIRRIRSLGLERGGGVPAVALTAYARTEDRLKTIMAGFQMHLSKPVDAAELLATVASLAGRMNGG